MPDDEEVTKRLREIDERISRLDRMWYERPFHEPRRVLEELYISPKSLLLFATLLNVALFIGGTVYTGIQVESIQKRYQDAAVKISEATQKYDDAEKSYAVADSRLKSSQELLTDTRKQTDDLLSEVGRKAKASADDMSDIRDKSERQLDGLKVKSAATLLSMTDFQKATEDDIRIAAAGVATKIENEVKSNKDAIEKKSKDVDALGLQIAGLSAEVQVKALALAKIQRAVEDQLAFAKSLNAEFEKKIKALARADKVTVPVAYVTSDIWLKLLFIGIILVVGAVPAGLFALWRIALLRTVLGR